MVYIACLDMNCSTASRQTIFANKNNHVYNCAWIATAKSLACLIVFCNTGISDVTAQWFMETWRQYYIFSKDVLDIVEA